MKKLVTILSLTLVIGIILICFFTWRQNNTDGISGGYGTHLRTLRCSVSAINEASLIVIAQEDGSEPETFKKGEQLKLNFNQMEKPIAPTELKLSLGEDLTVTYLVVEDTDDIPEISMHYPSKLSRHGTYILDN